MKSKLLQYLISTGRSLFGKNPPSAAQPVKPRKVTGFVENVDLHEISGWAVSQTGQTELVLVLDGEEFRSSVTWQERDDVTTALQCEEQMPGFTALIPQRLRRLLVSEFDAIDRLNVYVAGEKVERSGTVKIMRPKHVRVHEKNPIEEPIDYELSDDNTTAISGKLRIERVEGFTIYGEILGEPEGGSVEAAAIEIWCGGVNLECAVILGGDPDNPTAATPQEAPAGRLEFEIELPGYMWEHGDKDGCCHIKLAVAGAMVSMEPIGITRDHAREWFIDIADGYYGDRQYWPLLALEHLHFLGGGVGLDDQTSKYMHSVADTYNLAQFLPSGNDAVPLATDRELDVDVGKLIAWRALREFNENLPQWAGREYTLLLKVFATFELTEEQRVWLVFSLVPYFCRIGSFSLLLNHVPQADLQEFMHSQEAWKVTIVLPFLAAERNVSACTEVLWRLPKCIGWVNSECVSYTTQCVVDDRSGQIDSKSVRDYAYALIDLLRNMQDDYWSRLHDVELIKALALFFGDGLRWDERLTKDLVAAALRLYGMSPQFWQHIDELRVKGMEGGDELLVGKERFDRLRRVLSHPVKGKDELLGAWQCLEFFRRYENVEATAAERELICNALPTLSQDHEALSALNPVMALFALSQEDSIRVAAYPLQGQNVFTQQVPNLRRVLRSMNSTHMRAQKYAMQKNLAKLLEDLLGSVHNIDADRVAEKVQPILLAARGLAEQSDFFLGIDALATAYCILQDAAKPTHFLLDSIRHQFMGCIESAKKQEWPPSALVTLTTVLGQARSASGHIDQSLYFELVREMRQHYTSRLSDVPNVFEPAAEPAWRHAQAVMLWW